MNTLIIIQISVFVIATFFLIIISWRSLHNPAHHGFYRFFAFEYIVILVIINAPFWFLNPYSFLQIISWLFLFLSLFVVFPGFYLLKRKGDYKNRNSDSANYEFEDTVNLVDTGIYKYIRHPMYSSLILLAVGTLLKNVTSIGIVLTILAILFIIVTAKIEERENIKFFGSAYKNYMDNTKMFLPYIY
jgi:protein-S-isoprenylcysteine O-methyltransferase Ste14